MSSTIIIFIMQIVTMVTQFYLYRIYDQILSPVEIGFLLTLFTLMSWASLLDFGIVSSLRNSLPSLISMQKFSKANNIISSAYYNYFLVLAAIFFIISIICALWVYHLDGENIVFEFAHTRVNVYLIMILIIFATLVNLFFKLNTSIAFANLRPEFNFGVQMSFALSCALLIIPFTLAVNSDLLGVSLAHSISAILVGVASSILVFWSYTRLRPKFSARNNSKFVDLLSKGGSFFVIQLAAIAMYSTDSILIAVMFDYEQVAVYKINSKLFYVFILAQGAILSPLWSKYTLMSSKAAYEQIMNTWKGSMRLTIPIVVGILIMYIIAGYVHHLWFGHLTYYNEDVTIAIALLTIMMSFSSNFSTVYNGISENSLLVKISIVAAFLNCPISFWLVWGLGFGVEGVAYGTMLCLTAFVIILPIKMKKTVLRACDRVNAEVEVTKIG